MSWEGAITLPIGAMRSIGVTPWATSRRRVPKPGSPASCVSWRYACNHRLALDREVPPEALQVLVPIGCALAISNPSRGHRSLVRVVLLCEHDEDQREAWHSRDCALQDSQPVITEGCAKDLYRLELVEL